MLSFCCSLSSYNLFTSTATERTIIGSAILSQIGLLNFINELKKMLHYIAACYNITKQLVAGNKVAQNVAPWMDTLRGGGGGGGNGQIRSFSIKKDA